MDAIPYTSCLGGVPDANHLEEPGTSSDDCPSTPVTNMLDVQSDGMPLAVYASQNNVSTADSLANYAAQNSVSAASLAHQENGSKVYGEGELDDDKKREREHKKRSKNWTRPETLKLIQVRTELEERFRKSGRKNVLWDEIALSLQQANFSRDAQQCKDKWEKLTAGYKEVRDGARDKEDHPFYEELHRLLSWKAYKREGGPLGEVLEPKRLKGDSMCNRFAHPKEDEASYLLSNGVEMAGEYGEEGEPSSPRKTARPSENLMTFTDLAVIQGLLETVITRQQRFFKDLLDAVERKEQIREQLRQQREDKWREEDRAERYVFHNAMIVLIQRLLGERPGPVVATMMPATVSTQPDGIACHKKRSKNWKRGEVMHLIRLRKEMDAKFAKSSRRAALWDELGDKLMSLGVERDGKQCREKWDKLIAEYKDVSDGRKDKEESPYFAELASLFGRACNEEPNNDAMETSKEE